MQFDSAKNFLLDMSKNIRRALPDQTKGLPGSASFSLTGHSAASERPTSRTAIVLSTVVLQQVVFRTTGCI